MTAKHYRSAELVFGWSFYRQGSSGGTSSADEFLDAALSWFGDPDPRLGTAWEKGELLSALILTTVEVPSSLRKTPFDQDRVLMVPPGFKISVLARIPAARFIMPLSTGEILVAQPVLGSIYLFGPQADGTAAVSTVIEDLQSPQGMALHRSDDKLYLFVGESNQVSRLLIAPGATSSGDKTVIVPNLPDSSNIELRGPYRHWLKNLVIGPDNKLYVDIASSTNADPVDTTSNPVRSAIYQYDLDGSNGRIFARGICNAEGLGFVPGTNELWAAVNETDDILYPFHNSWQGSGSIDYGKLITSYVDDHPPDEFIHVKQGGNYGWPSANPDPDTPNGLHNMLFAANYAGLFLEDFRQALSRCSRPAYPERMWWRCAEEAERRDLARKLNDHYQTLHAKSTAHRPAPATRNCSAGRRTEKSQASVLKRDR